MRRSHCIARYAAALVFAGGVAQPVVAETLEAPGIIVAEREATISAGLAAQIVELPFKEGEAFSEGDRLVTFDCARYEAERKEARATLGAASARHSVNKELDAYGAIGKGEVRASGAETGAAAARVEALSELVKLCAVDAPFSGRVQSLGAQLFETPKEGDPLISLIDDSELVIEVIAPSIWLRWMRVGEPMQFEVRETGDILEAEIVRLGASVDPVSQSIDVVARIVERPGLVLPGMSGRAVLRSE
ncbi:MAG: HlyD family efflux transporter periplasmic adaptor subunit [Pseudomonadota bacterium]